MFKKRTLSMVLLMAVVGAGMVASGLVSASGLQAERDDCPGVIACPLTDEPVCRDRCPVGPGLLQAESKQASCCKVKK